MDLTKFKQAVRTYLRTVNRSQKDLADEIGLHPVVLSHKLAGTPRYTLTHSEIKQLILCLARWHALYDRSEVIALLKMLALPTTAIFSSEDWNAPPLAFLENETTPAQPAAFSKTANVTPEPTAPAHNLPQVLTSFIGRERELSELNTMLQDPACRLITLAGTGGVGKTRMAIQVGLENIANFNAGVYFVELAALREVTQVPLKIAESLNIEKATITTSSIIDILKEKATLLILDNFEHVVEASQFLQELLLNTKYLKILITSRSTLQIYGEQVYELTPLALPRVAQAADEGLEEKFVDNLARNEAVQLFYQRARAVRPDFELDSKNILAVIEICKQLDGLPLAIELAASRSKLFTPQALATRLGSRLDLPIKERGFGHKQQQTLRSTLDWSYDLLERAEQDLFAGLCTFTGSYSMEAVEAIVGDWLVKRYRTSDISLLLESLLNKSMLRLASSFDPNQPRFEMLETLREYGTLKLSNLGEPETVALKNYHSEYYINLAKRAEPEMIGAEQAYWFSLLESDLPNLRQALDWQIGNANLERAIGLAVCLSRFWLERGHLTEGRKWLEQLIGLAENANAPKSQTLVEAVSWLCILARQQGDYEKAILAAEQSIAISHELDYAKGIAEGLQNLGVLGYYRSDFKTAQKYLEEALPYTYQINDKHTLAFTLNTLGAIMYVQQDFKAAKNYFSESLTLLEGFGDKVSACSILNNLAAIETEAGNYTAAYNYHKRALDTQREMLNKRGIAATLHFLGTLSILRHNYIQAKIYLKECQTIWIEQGDERGIANSTLSLGTLALAQKQFELAETYLKRGFRLASKLAQGREIVIALENLAYTYIEQGYLQQGALLLGAAQKAEKNLSIKLTFAQEEKRRYYLVVLKNNYPDYDKAWQEGEVTELEELAFI